MATPLWLAKIDSPSSGAVSTIVDTSAGTAVNLTCTSVTGTSIASGVGASFGSSSGAVSGSLSGTKIATALAGATRCTLEGEFDTTSDAGFMDMLSLQATSFDDFCSMFTGSAGASRVAIAAAGGIVYYTVTPGRHRFLAIIDTPQATNTNRFTLYVDGSAAPVDSGVAPSWPAQNAAIDTGFTNWANNRLAIGCLISAGVQAFQGPVYLAALYSSALTSTDATAHNTAIAANNDADPNAGGTVNPPFDQQPTVRLIQRLPPARQTEVPPQLGVKTGTGLPDVQGRATPPLRRYPSPDFEALPPRVVVGAPPPVDSPTTPRRIYLALAPQQTEVPPQLGVATGTGLPDVQGAAVVPLRRLPGAPIDPLPPLAAAVVAPPPVDCPTVPRRLVLVSSRPADELPPVAASPPPPPVDSPPARMPLLRRPAAQSTDVPPQLGVKTGTGLPDVQGLVARAIRRIVQPLNDPAPPLPFKASPILDIQPVRRFMRLVRTVFTDLGSWLALPIVASLRPPFVAVVDDYSTSVVPDAQQLTVTVDAQSLTLDADT